MDLIVKKKCELGKITWEYPALENDKYGRLLAGHEGGNGQELMEEIGATRLRFGGYYIDTDTNGKATAGNQIVFTGDWPPFLDADSADERAEKLAARITTVHNWIQACLENDQRQTKTGHAFLSEEIERAYVMRATEKAMAEKQDDPLPF